MAVCKLKRLCSVTASEREREKERGREGERGGRELKGKGGGEDRENSKTLFYMQFRFSQKNLTTSPC